MTAEQIATGACLVALIGGLVTFYRWARPFYRRAKQDVVSGRDALLGRDEIRDSITGRVIAPALPGMGIRMDRNETQMAAVVDAVAQIAPALTQLAESHRRQEETDKRLDAHEQRIEKLETAAVERIVTRADSAAGWRAIEAVAKHDHDT